MYLERVQRSLYDLCKNSGIGVVLLQLSKILALVYPIYLILCNFNFLNPVMGIIRIFAAVLYFAYVAGLITSFAKNDMIIVSAAFGLKAIDYIIGLIMYSFNITTLSYAVLYVILAVWALYKTNSVNN